MFHTIRTLGDRLLSALMHNTEAGACVPINGHACTLAGH